jgi:geranylgeranyl transferase type-2 subunit beta
MLKQLSKIISCLQGRLGARFAEPVLKYIAARQLPNGGWAGKSGEADIYYTRFALRGFDLTVQNSLKASCFAKAADWLRSIGFRPTDIVDAFCILDSLEVLGHIPGVLDDPGIVDAIKSCRDLIRGNKAPNGYGRNAGEPASIYHTFLGHMAEGILERTGFICPEERLTPEAVYGLLSERVRHDGGFCDSPAGTTSQTNPTAAAVALAKIAMADEWVEDASAGFLLAMQRDGFLATPESPEADLLSTCSALTALKMCGQAKNVKSAKCARFIRSCLSTSGGFGAYPEDPQPDVEYTYYGLLSLGIICQPEICEKRNHTSG